MDELKILIMEFTIEQNELSISFIEKAIFSFRTKNYGNYPARILLSQRNTIKVCREFESLAGIAAGLEPPFKIWGIKIFRCLDIEENKLEIH